MEANVSQQVERFPRIPLWELSIPIKQFIPDWDKYGKSAGMIRNKQMAEYATELLLIWVGESKGSAHMKKEAEKRGLKITEIIWK